MWKEWPVRLKQFKINEKGSFTGWVKRQAMNTVEALVSDYLGNSEKWSQLELSPTRMGSRNRPHDETIESDRL